MKKLLLTLIFPLALLAYGSSAVAWTVTNNTGYMIMVANGGLPANFDQVLEPGEVGACAAGAEGCGATIWNSASANDPNQYMTMARANTFEGGATEQLCAGSGVPANGSIVYSVSPSNGAWMASIYDVNGNQIWSGNLQGDPINGHNSKGGIQYTNYKNNNNKLQSTWCGPNSYNP